MTDDREKRYQNDIGKVTLKQQIQLNVIFCLFLFVFIDIIVI